MQVYLDAMQKEYQGKHIVLVWDGAPCHKLKAFQRRENMTIIPLPSYSPQLNPTERFFGEIRKGTANKIFDGIQDQEKEIDKSVMEFVNDTKKIKRLVGYAWILKQWDRVF